VRRARIALLLAAIAGCSDPPAQECPGAPIAQFHFGGTLIFRDDPELAGLDPVPAIPDCSTAESDPLAFPPVLPEFDGLLAADPATQVAALCRQRGFVLFGQRSGAHYAVENTTDGAVLSSCSQTCTAALRLVVVGDVTGGADAPLSFAGWLVELMTKVGAGDCGTCPLGPLAPSCAARYKLTGAAL
jgi:hypothetical protein